MKRTFTLCLFILGVMINRHANAATCTANLVGGDWTNPLTWSGGAIPECGDVINIPFGSIVVIDVNVDLSACSAVNLNISGTLTFRKNRTLTLPAGSCIGISLAGTILPNALLFNTNKILIGASTAWTGSTVLDLVVGPVGFGCSTLLPVELVDFSITYLNNQAELTFTTASERDLQNFVLEVSKDGSYWQELGNLPAEGNSSEGKTYTIEDKNPFSGVSYYRLNSIDHNGFKAELGFISGDYKILSYLSYPVPVNKTMFLEGEDLDKAMISVINSMGEKIDVEQTFIGDKISFDFGNIKSGIYFLEIENEYVKKTERIAVVHK